jgi:hypothetical protein
MSPRHVIPSAARNLALIPPSTGQCGIPLPRLRDRNDTWVLISPQRETTPHPSPSADGLVKAPPAGHPLPKGEGKEFLTAGISNPPPHTAHLTPGTRHLPLET